MPQSGEAGIETVKINSWLKNHAGWPLRCIVLLAMRTRLSAATTRGEGGEEIPDWCDLVAGWRSDAPNVQDVSKDLTIHVTQKKGDYHVERHSSVCEGRRRCLGC